MSKIAASHVIALSAILSVANLVSGQGSSSASDSRQAVPDPPLGDTRPWILADQRGRRIAYVGASGPVQEYTCQSGKISFWSMSNTKEYNYLGKLSATCTSGEELEEITVGYNSSGTYCSTALRGAYTVVTPVSNTFNASAVKVIDAFLTATNSRSDRFRTFSCPSGTSAIGYRAQSACLSLAGLSVICGRIASMSSMPSVSPTPRPMTPSPTTQPPNGASAALTELPAAPVLPPASNETSPLASPPRVRALRDVPPSAG